MLEIKNISSGYSGSRIIQDASLEVPEGKIVSVLGPNGAGKTTLLRTVMNLASADKGEIIYNGKDITNAGTEQITLEEGICFIPQEEGFFPDLTVEEHLELAINVSETDREKNLERVFELFPTLEERKQQKAESLSGGETKMLSVARGLVQEPDLILLDEFSLGLMPKLVKSMYSTLRELNESKNIEMLITEQSMGPALENTEYTYVLEGGEIRMSGAADELKDNKEQVKKAFFGKMEE